MKFIPKKIEGKTPIQVAIMHRDRLLALKEEYKRWADGLTDERPQGRIRDIDERISATIEFINEEGMREIDALLDKMVEKGIF